MSFSTRIAFIFTHKSVLSALVNKSIWPSNGSHTLNLQDEDLMYNNYSDLNSSPPHQSNHYGYPNLGRPYDHFDITPFEAVYVSDYIIPHINLKDVTPKWKYVDPINEFIKNEVEPCYLYLQNQNLGAQVRSNYTYKARRRANNVITTGHLVTPKTDPGDYNVEPNADLILEAGQAIVLKPGTHIKAGAKAHLWIHYESCERVPRTCSVSGMAQHNHNLSNNRNRSLKQYTNESAAGQEQLRKTGNAINVFPNPTNSSFTVTSSVEKIQKIEIYNLSGEHIKTENRLNQKRYRLKEKLDSGIYLLIIQTKSGKVYHKKIVVL